MAKKTINSKSTKNDIYDAYKEVLNELDKVQKEKQTPEKIQQEVAKKEVIKKAEEVKPTKNQTMLDTIQEKIELINIELERYNDIKDAIDIKKKELDTIYKIQVEANSLFALINLQKEEKMKYEAEFKARKEETDEYVRQRESETVEMLRKNSEIMESQRKKFKEDSKKTEEEWKYDFDRKKQKDLDSLEDELAVLRKSWNDKKTEQEKELANREVKCVGIELDHETLQKEYEELKASMQTKIGEAVDKAKETAKTSYDHQVRYIKRDFEAKVELLQSQNESLLTNLEKEIKQKENLENKLDESYKRLQQIANKTVEGASNNNIAQQLQALTNKEK